MKRRKNGFPHQFLKLQKTEYNPALNLARAATVFCLLDCAAVILKMDGNTHPYPTSFIETPNARFRKPLADKSVAKQDKI